MTQLSRPLLACAGLLVLACPAPAARRPVLPAASAPQADQPLALDGRPGLGSQRTAREFGRLFRSPTEQEQVLLTGLYELSSDLLVLREMARRVYVRRGYFKTLKRQPEPGLDDLHANFREQLPLAQEVLLKGGKHASRLLDMMLDLRFRLRIELLEIFAEEGPQLRKGLALLKASQDGYYDLKDREARAIASRVDLSAARLRAVRSDLDALRERGDRGAPGSVDPLLRQKLLSVKKIDTLDGRKRAVQEVETQLAQSISRLRSVLSSPRLEPRLQADLDRRRTLLDEALRHLQRTQSYQIVPPFDQNPPEVVLQMSRAERHRYALSEGLRGLDLDPLNEQLTYLTGAAAAEIQDPLLSRVWFDRFLALRGIRSADHRTMRGKDLTPEEKRSIEEVARALMGPGSGFGPH